MEEPEPAHTADAQSGLRTGRTTDSALPVRGAEFSRLRETHTSVHTNTPQTVPAHDGFSRDFSTLNDVKATL